MAMPSATTKRSRRAAFDEDDDDDGATTVRASSSLRSETHRKKARTSNDTSSRKSAFMSRQESSDGSEEEEDDDDDEDDEAVQDADAPSATQYETLRDAGFRHLEHTDMDDQRATQRLKNRPQILGDNQIALNAIIESITCINFMCHTKLHVELGPLLNFIVGENGSGKSAVLTAITLCLGGKASATNRGGSLRSFVKEGQEHANLIVKIKNQGPDAYKPHEFGESIIVERHFTKSGSSGFRLKSVTGKIMSTKKGDVDDVVEYYCLQVDNPLNVLSQDNARQFLNAATPTKKYQFFVKGTQLEQLDQDYQLLQETLESNETRLLAFEGDISCLKETCEKAVQQRDSLVQNTQLKNRRTVLRNQLAWSQVVQQETILQQMENKVLAAKAEIEQADETVTEKTRILTGIDEKVQEAQEALDRRNEEENQFKEQEEEARSKFDESKQMIEATHKQERDMYDLLNAADKTVKQYENLISEEEKRLEEVNGGALTEKQNELEHAKHMVVEIIQSQKTHAESASKLANERDDAVKKAQDSSDLVKQKQQDVSAAERRLRASQQNRSDPYAGFERQIPQLLELIARDTGFAQKPIGPIGTFVELTKPRWSSIVEKVFGGTLNGFIVGSKADQSRLFHHMETLKIQNCQIFISSRAPLGNLREPEERFDTILRVLKIDDIRVRDLLVINHSIEQTILIENREEGERVMFDGRPPENVLACLSLHDKKRGWGLRLTNRGGNIATSPMQPYDGKSRMKSENVESQINYLKENLGQLQAELRELELSNRTLQQAAHRCVQAIVQHKKQTADFEKELRNAEARVARIEQELDEFDGADNKLQGYKNDLREAQNSKDHYGNQFGELSLQKQELNKEVEALQRKFKEAKLALKDHQAKITKARDKVERFQETRRVALLEKNQAYHNLEMAKAGRDQLEKSRAKQVDVVKDHSRLASEVAPERPHIPEGDTYHKIERNYNSVRDELEKIRNQLGGTDEEITERAAQAVRAFREAKKNYKNMTSLVQELKKALMDRLRKWRTFQRLISAHARTNFSYLLSERGFRGELLLDHQQKKLQIQVEPDETKKSSSGRNTKTLSGGEKSFSSICMLLAIWDAMGSPLRCLDEFDVFMDNVNRAISTNMLISAARRSVGKQFILITPNAIEGRANIDKDVKIIRQVFHPLIIQSISCVA
ncbi:P-loop containing nucleoside triphosphate hydrolase protein [Hypoxylon sp. FL1150]|nr:P-loop containing nucleoside triphosphate hydrolase protein [Hypoxylon sp. FL1150]